MENFLPALLPALRIGIKLIGRPKVLSFLAKFLAPLIQRFVGPQYAPALSQAIVDAGLRMLQMEAASGEEPRAAASAVAATVEETVRRVAALPDYVLDNRELLEGFALEAFEQAAAANLPPVLPEAVYRKRPELREHRRGLWYRQQGRRYKKRLGPRVSVKLTPHRAGALETLDGDTVGEVLEELYGVAPGEEVEAFVHLYETLPGANLAYIARHEDVIPRVDGLQADDQLYPLTREAAALLLDEPDLGREAETYEDADPSAPPVGQRFYYLEIPGRRPLAAPGPNGKTRARRRTRARLILDFPKNEARVYVFLSEIRAQEIAVKLRQNAHIGPVTVRLRRIIHSGISRAFAGNPKRLKLIHEATPPGQGAAALRRLPSVVLVALRGRLIEWAVKAVADHLQQRTGEFVKAAEDTADGVTLVITLASPPGFPQLRDALKARTVSLATLNVAEGVPEVSISIYPGYKHE